MTDDRDIWAAALRGKQGMIPDLGSLLRRFGLDFTELLRDNIQRDAAIAADNHVAADARPRLPQAVPQLVHARLNLVSELFRAILQSCELLLFVRHDQSFVRNSATRQAGGPVPSLANMADAWQPGGPRLWMRGRRMAAGLRDLSETR